ncbi:MAG: hypothetical protein ACXIUV_10675 [Alkalilacustris sp.]
MSGNKQRRDGKAKAAPAKATTAKTTTGVVPEENVRTREVQTMEQYGAGILAVMFALDEAAKENKRVPQMVHGAKLFLIAVIFIAPVLLMWQHAF